MPSTAMPFTFITESDGSSLPVEAVRCRSASGSAEADAESWVLTAPRTMALVKNWTLLPRIHA